MVKRVHIWIAFVFLIIPYFGFSTHIVGGTLTYVYNGGSSYTITLKLFRDCSPTSASFPANVNIVVTGYNGATFSPGRDISIALGPVTPVTPVLDPCAIPPNPMPCVEQGLYTITVNNLPPNPGGYHLYYQLIARNLSLSNVNAVCNCVGESYYAIIPGPTVNWGEEFTLANGTTVDNGATAWSISAGVPAPATARVNGNLFEITGVNNASETWISQIITIAAFPAGVNARVNLSEAGTLEPNDSIFVYYRLNGGPLTLFPTNGFIADDFTTAVASVSGLIGTTLQIIIRVHYDVSSPNSEIYRFDNVLVDGANFINNSDPVFTLFPPLFLCVGQPFTFDHSATDANGDSLYYSFYTPYNGDNGVGALDPTFSGNVANFTPIVWQPGYSLTNPLGGPALNLNPLTGLLTGTPSMLGQFVVGVMVKEYRNGVYIGQTLRDFQFNIVNCPQPPVAVGGTDITINDGCVGTITASGFNAATVVWNSIYPGAAGAYNNYLSCSSGCLNPTATSVGTPPAYVDYQICGITTSCNPTNVCDTVRVTFHPTLLVTIAPQNPTICFGQTSTMLTATGSGGTPPYSYLWNNVNPSQSISVGVGTYTVKLSDASGCPPTFATVTVTAYSVTITANAGPDQTICSQNNPLATLNGSVAGASGGIWLGGAGVFSPNNTTLSNVFYSPSVAEITNGYVDLTLTTTGNGSCPPGSDIVRINFVGFTGSVTVSPDNVSCFGGNNGSATVSVTGGISPYTYSWNTVPAQSAVTAVNLSQGVYGLTVYDGLGCSFLTSATITQPAPLVLARVITNVSCFGGSNGSIAVTPTGGTPPYTYLWLPGAQTTSSILSKPAGTYTVTVTDSKGCQITASYLITQPTPIVISFLQTNVSCFNGTDGTANSTVSGGTPPYSYSWSTGATSPNVTGLQAGTFLLTITDNKGCVKSGTVVITQPTAVIASTTVVNETCNYLNNGSATAIAIGGTPGYNYLWQPGGLTGSLISNLSSGTYTLTATDSKGCITTAFATITEPAPLTVNFINQINVSCFGGNNGSVTANTSGGTPNYTYLWMPGGSTTATLSNVQIGTYTVTVTDNNGCQIQNSVVITQPSPLAVSSAIAHVTCSGGSNGSITANPSGGTVPYSYFWLPGGQTTSSINFNPVGTYTVTVTDGKGCNVTGNYTIVQPSPIVISFTQTNVSCFSGSNGTANASVSGGSAPYTYSWSMGATTPNINSLPAGAFTLIVKDNNGCLATSTVLITQPTAVIANTIIVNETCNYLNNGTATASGAGGTPGYTYFWQPGNQTTSSINNLPAGVYTVTITDSKGCPATATATITQPAPLVVNFINQVNVSCFGGNNGSVTANSTGGTPNYTVLWMPGGITTATLGNIPIGTYTVTATDNKGCQVQNSVVITQPAPLAVSSVISPVSCSGGSDGSILVSPTGGTVPYTYLWQPGGQTTGQISGKPAGNYSVTVTDAKGCQVTGNYTITQPLPISVAFTQTDAGCFNGSNGTAISIVSGGTAPFTYNWSTGASTANVTGLQAGSYTLTVTDNNNCVASNSVVIGQPTMVTASIIGVNETCNYLNNGSASANASGGTPGYTYVWQPGNLVTPTIANLSAGTYTVTATDTKGCQGTAAVTITQPPTLAVNFINQLNVSCFGGSNGSATANPSGGTPNYSYLWMPGGITTATISNIQAGTYNVTVTDNKGCLVQNPVVITQATPLVLTRIITKVSCWGGNDGAISVTATGGTAPYTYLWQPGNQTTSAISSKPAGPYTVTVTDSKGCQITANYIITQPPQITVSFTRTNVFCYGGSTGIANSTVSGGNPPYSYLWNTGATSPGITGLQAGTYTLTITDTKGCIKSGTVVITQSTLLIAGTTHINETCDYLNNGSASASASGGSPGYTYSWQPGNQTTSSISSLPAGIYTVTVTDSKGCPATAIATITQPAPLAIGFIGQQNVTCFGGNNGSVSAIPSGGTPNYSYSWLPGLSTSSVITGLNAGTYTLTVTDNKSCQVQSPVTITQPIAPLTVSTSFTPPSCNGGTNGSVSSIPSGGTGPYTYSWTPGNYNGQTVSNVSAGTYSVTVTDSNGCTSTNSVTVIEPVELVLLSGAINSDCGVPNGLAYVSVSSGGIAPFTYFWSPVTSSNDTATGFISGVYTVIVTDADGCTATSTGNVNENTAALANISSITNTSCNGGSNGSATVSLTGGVGPFSYAWAPTGGIGATASGLVAGTYTVTVVGSNGCQSHVNATITEPTPILINVSTNSVSCYTGNNGAAAVSASGGTAGYSFQWLPGGTTGSTISNLAANTYTVQVTDTNSCVQSSNFVISQPAQFVTSIASSTNVSCFGGADGSVSASALGGTSPYSFNWMPGNFPGQAISNLPAGNYSVTATDVNGCTATNSVTISQPTLIVLTTDSVNSQCSLSNGEASVSATGGISPYSYQWSPSGGTDILATNILSGGYSVVVTDSLGCTSTTNVTVNDSPSPAATVSSVTDVSCNGGSDGTATVSVTGGTPPFTYSWLPSGGTAAIATGLMVGSYTVTVFDDNGCESLPAISLAITEPPLIEPLVVTSGASCFGGTDGSATVSASGGTPGYTYQWLPGGSTGSSINNLPANTYTVQVTDTNSCMQAATYTIAEPTVLMASISTSTNVSCFGGSNGAASASASGGTEPFNYNWMPGNYAGQDVSNLSQGNYTVTVTDNNGCTTSISVLVSQPAPIVLLTGSINSNCSLSNGEASVSASGGTGLFTYQWSPSGGIDSVATNLFSGDYSIVVTDSFNCISATIITVNDNPSPVATVSAVTHVSCNGGSDGTATVSVSGGAPPFNYSWLPSGGIAATATGLTIGTYTVIVLDDNGCESLPAISLAITEPTVIVPVVTTNATSCFGGTDGAASVSASGGTPGYSFLWLPGGTTGSGVINLSAGTYTVQVTDTNSCPQTSTFIISEPPLLLASISSSTNVSCFGGEDGSASASASGGTGPYNFNWMPGNYSGQNISNLFIDTYSVTATDANGCSATNTVIITQPSPLIHTTGSTNSYCSLPNGQAYVSVSGGVSPYTYQWSPPGITDSISTNLLPGQYDILISDANGCNSIADVTVNDDPAAIANVSSVTNVSCNGGSDGTATATVSGGVAPFSYAWSPIGGTGATGTGLTEGTYTVVITDAAGCQLLPAISPFITQPLPILPLISTINVSCFGGTNGSASANATGGTPGYTYNWLSSGSNGLTIQNLSANTYTLEVRDTNNCLQTSTFTISQPDELTSSITSTTNVSCFDGNNGTATVSVLGGTPVYNYSWLPSGGNGATGTGLFEGTYSVSVTDINGCTAATSASITQPSQALSASSAGSSTSCSGGSDAAASVIPAGGTPGYSYQWSPSGGTEQNAIGLSSGIYTVLVTDTNSCQTNVSVAVSQPFPVNASLISTDPSCGFSNGSISSQVSGGTSPYSYLWSPGSSNNSGIVGASPGSYTLVITDANNCSISLSEVLTNIPGPTVAISSISNVSCYGGSDGSASLNISQGTGPYSTNWLPYGGDSLTASSLAIGTFTVIVTDSLGCVASDSVIIIQPTPITILLDSISEVLCYGENTGSISVSASGGTPAYTYSWLPFGGNSSFVDSLTTGTYSVVVIDQNLCHTSVSVNVTQPLALLASVDSTINPSCYNSTNGSAFVDVSGGTIPYSYLWSNGETGSFTNNLSAGSDLVTIHDANGCTISSNFILTQPTQIITSAGTNDTICYGQSGVVTATASGGGTGIYNFAWQPLGVNNAGILTINPLTNTTYTVYAYDQNGCQGTPDTVNAIIYSLSGANTVVNGMSPICPGESSVVSVQTTGTTGPLTYSWNNNLGNGPGGYIVTPIQPTTYIVTVSNSCGTSVTDSVQILFNPPPVISLEPDSGSFCAPGTIQFFDNSITGNINDPIYNWYWNFGDGTSSTLQNPDHFYADAGTYFVSLTVTTEHGCTNNNFSSPIIITTYPFPVAAFSVNSHELDLPYDVLVCENQSIGADTYLWDFGDGSTSSSIHPNYLYTTIGNFNIQLIATTSHGCSDKANTDVTTNAEVVFPNVFTPNPDGSSGGSYNENSYSNDVFFPYTSGVTEFNIQIFDRWGELIFESNDLKQGWDGYYRGKLCQQDVYVWKAHLKLNNGKEFNKTGDVTLLR